MVLLPNESGSYIDHSMRWSQLFCEASDFMLTTVLRHLACCNVVKLAFRDTNYDRDIMSECLRASKSTARVLVCGIIDD